ncbi:MAG: hypothetical protein KDA61_03520, partial [Planctomycetales bacterium]|nr:hypothetical protein [Planctomycetales bacterium]
LRRIASEDEAATLSNDWERGREITTPGVQFSATGDEAFQLDLAQELVSDFNEFRRAYSLEGDPALVEPSWATVLIEALASPGLAWILLLIGGAALWIELQTPGVGVGGFAAAVCFLLFFWSRYLQGTAMWLEAILFLAGVICILLEMFVVPGVGIFGIGGGLLIIFSIVLASQTFIIPQNDYQLGQLRDTMATILGAMVGGGVLIVVLNRFLPHTPVLNRMVLAPPDEMERQELAMRESVADWAHLLGARGIAATRLLPSGRARFDDDLVDVITRGEAIDAGAEVEVVEAMGSRIVVRAVEGPVA